MPGFSTTTTALLRRNYLLLAGAFLPLVVGVLAAWLAVPRTLDVYALCAAMVGIPCGLILVPFTLTANPRPVPSRGRLVIDDAAITWKGKLLARRADIVAGLVVPGPRADRPTVRLSRRFPRGAVELAPRDADEARAILGALELDAASAVASFAVSAPTHAHWFLFWLGVLGVLIGGSVVFPVNLLLAVVLVVLHSIPARLVVGADGLHLRWLGWRRFVPYGDVASIAPRGGLGGPDAGWIVRRTSGRSLSILVLSRFLAELRVRNFALIDQRLTEARAEHQRRTDGPGAALPERGGRTTREWVRLLRAFGSGAHADHRTAPAQLDDLVRLVEDVSADPSARAGAAVALGAQGEQGRARLRIAAGSTALPEVREMLRIAAEETEEEPLAEALERVVRR
jgi:hypothetical protein